MRQTSDGTQYKLYIENDTDQVLDFCVFQNDPDIGNPNVMSTAWFVETLAPSTHSRINWQIDWDLSWDQTGELVPGVTFDSSQIWPADPGAQGVWCTPQTPGDQVSFEYRSDSYFTFSGDDGKPHHPSPGTLYIYQEASIPLQTASVGLGMSNKPVYAMQAEPSMQASFTPHPAYFIAAGTFQEYTVLDVASITDSGAIKFPANVYSMTATLDNQHVWHIAPTGQVVRKKLQTSSR